MDGLGVLWNESRLWGCDIQGWMLVMLFKKYFLRMKLLFWTPVDLKRGVLKVNRWAAGFEEKTMDFRQNLLPWQLFLHKSMKPRHCQDVSHAMLFFAAESLWICWQHLNVCWTFLSCQSSISQVHWNANIHILHLVFVHVSHFVCASCADELIRDAVSTVFTLAVSWVASTLLLTAKCLMMSTVKTVRKLTWNPQIGGLGWCSLLSRLGVLASVFSVRGYWWWYKPFESFGRWYFDWCLAVVTFPATM